MIIDESKLQPFDLERAKAGDKVVFRSGSGIRPVLESSWTIDTDQMFAVLLQYDDEVTWTLVYDSDLRMAPKTRTLWYGWFKKCGILSTSIPFSSAEELRQKAKNQDCEILAIHSFEVPE